MLRYLAMISAQQLNIFPAKGGVSAYYSPHMIIRGENYDFAVQAYQEQDPKNTNAPRTYDAIYLRPMTNTQGAHEVMDLNSGRIKPMRVWELPVTNLVINAVETMAENQGIKSLKMSNRNNI